MFQCCALSKGWSIKFEKKAQGLYFENYLTNFIEILEAGREYRRQPLFQILWITVRVLERYHEKSKVMSEKISDILFQVRIHSAKGISKRHHLKTTEYIPIKFAWFIHYSVLCQILNFECYWSRLRKCPFLWWRCCLKCASIASSTIWRNRWLSNKIVFLSEAYSLMKLKWKI